MKRKLLLVFLLMNSTVPFSTMYGDDQITSVQQQELFFELQDNTISADEEYMFDAVDQTPQEPSMLWTWFCMAGSTVVVNYIYTKRYIVRRLDHMRIMWRYYMARNKKK